MSSKSRQAVSHVAIPIERDFDPCGCGLDAQSAWRKFGGLSVAEALMKFRENPLNYQEDFMFMGGGAFLFYFPVIDTYLREFRPTDHLDDSQAALIGSGIVAQLSWLNPPLQPLHSAIRSLADYVCSHTDLLAGDPDEQSRIAREWQEVYTTLNASTP